MKIKNLKTNALASVLILFLLCSCGRKPKNIFSFDEENHPRVNKLALPTVQGVSAKKTPQGNLVAWFALEIPSKPTPAKPYLCFKCFSGYNVYRLVRTNVIPKHPCNKHPLRETFFLDSKKTHTQKPCYYLIKAVFTYNGITMEGPISHITRTQE